MGIEDFISNSVGTWISMRTGHSLAFKHFEEVVSTLRINLLNKNDLRVNILLDKSEYSNRKANHPFEIIWESESDWEQKENNTESKGSCVLIAISTSDNEGIFIRSQGYTEKILALSNYYFLDDGTIVITTDYEQTTAEERIWFASRNVRCRASIIRSLNTKGILQTSFASEIRKISES